jgi:hypothetical protein
VGQKSHTPTHRSLLATFASSPACELRAQAYRTDSVARIIAGRIFAMLSIHSIDEPQMQILGAQLVARIDAVISVERSVA